MSDWFKQAILSLAILGFFAAAPAAAQAPFDPPGLDRAMAAKAFHVDALMEGDGVVGVGVGLTAGGQAAVVIMTEGPGVGGLPRSLDGVPVVIMVTGAFNAVNKPDENGNHNHGTEEDPPVDPSADPCDSEPTAECTWPVPIGVSTGNGSGASCSAGTIGARVKDAAGVYALSNNHVYALENKAIADDPMTDGVDEGDNIVQPGLFDTNCSFASADVIGTLTDFEPIVFSTSANNRIDAAIALSSTAALDNATPSDGYGIPNSSVFVGTVLGLAVQKYGRTTGLTRGTVTMIDATVNVGYSSGTARFVEQIIVEVPKKGGFLKAGDSGSLLVTDDDWADPVGLLFAANRRGTLAVANPIDLVLDAFGVTIDGK